MLDWFYPSQLIFMFITSFSNFFVWYSETFKFCGAIQIITYETLEVKVWWIAAKGCRAHLDCSHEVRKYYFKQDLNSSFNYFNRRWIYLLTFALPILSPSLPLCYSLSLSLFLSLSLSRIWTKKSFSPQSSSISIHSNDLRKGIWIKWCVIQLLWPYKRPETKTKCYKK